MQGEHVLLMVVPVIITIMIFRIKEKKSKLGTKSERGFMGRVGPTDRLGPL
jgi:hypothetical protein